MVKRGLSGGCGNEGALVVGFFLSSAAAQERCAVTEPNHYQVCSEKVLVKLAQGQDRVEAGGV